MNKYTLAIYIVLPAVVTVAMLVAVFTLGGP